MFEDLFNDLPIKSGPVWRRASEQYMKKGPTKSELNISCQT